MIKRYRNPRLHYLLYSLLQLVEDYSSYSEINLKRLNFGQKAGLFDNRKNIVLFVAETENTLELHISDMPHPSVFHTRCLGGEFFPRKHGKKYRETSLATRLVTLS